VSAISALAAVSLSTVQTPCRSAYSLLRIPAKVGLLSRGHRCKEHKSSDGRVGDIGLSLDSLVHNGRKPEHNPFRICDVPETRLVRSLELFWGAIVRPVRQRLVVSPHCVVTRCILGHVLVAHRERMLEGLRRLAVEPHVELIDEAFE
jgi:hypothetical protein